MADIKSGYNETDIPEGQRRPMRLTRWEMETTINYNAEEKIAVLYTRDKAVMRKLDRMVEKCPDVYKLVRESEIDKTYEFPKKLLSFRTPRVLTDEQREEMADRLMKARTKQQGTGPDDYDEDMDDEEIDDEEETDCI